MPHFNTKFQVDKYRVAGNYTENECYKYPNEYYIIKLTQNINNVLSMTRMWNSLLK